MTCDLCFVPADHSSTLQFGFTICIRDTFKKVPVISCKICFVFSMVAACCPYAKKMN